MGMILKPYLNLLSPGPKQVPTGRLRIDWTHPLARGLVACYVPGAMGGTNVTNLSPPLTPQSASYISATEEGPALRSTEGNTGYVSTFVPDAFLNASEYTLYWRGYVFPLGSAGNYSPIIGTSYSTTNISPYVHVQICSSGDQNYWAASWNTGGTWQLGLAFARTTGQSSIGCTFKVNGSARMYNAGLEVANSGFGASAPTYNNPTLGINSLIPTPTRYTNTVCNIGCFWNRVLSASEMQWLDQEPYAFLVSELDEPPHRRPLVLGSDVLDYGLKELGQTDQIHVLSQEPSSFADVASYTLGKKELAHPPVLLMHMDGADGSTVFTDASTNRHVVVVHGHAQIDTAQSKFGSASAFFDSNGDDYLTLDYSNDFAFGTGDFTIDCWIRLGNLGYWQTFFENNNSSWTYGPTIKVGQNNNVVVTVRTVGDIIGSIILTTGVWYHIAVTRSGTILRLFVDGVQDGTPLTTGIDFNTDPDSYPKIGRNFSASEYLRGGWLDELRIIKGYAAWTSDFTPPDVPYELLFSEPQAALPTGRKVVSAAVGNGAATAGGLATEWAAVDSAGSRLLARGAIKTPFNVAAGASFALSPVTIHSGGDEFWLPYVDGSYAAMMADIANDQYWYDSAEYNSLSAWMTAVGATLSRNHASYYVGDDGYMHQASVNAPRIEYDPVTGACRGLLLEPERENLCYSSVINATRWADWNTVRTYDDALSPDGTFTATRVAASTTDTGILYTSGSGVSGLVGDVYTASGFLKDNGATYGAVGIQDGEQFNVVFVSVDLRIGKVNSFGVDTGTNWTFVDYSVEPFSNGWWRLSVTGILNVNKIIRRGHLRVGYGSTGNINRSIHAWGIQLEKASSASSYIPTTTGAITRPQDLLQFPNGSNAADLHDQAAYTEFMQVYKMRQASAARLLGAPATTYYRFKRDGANVESYTGSALDAALGAYSGPWMSHDVMLARSQDASGQSLCANGGTVTSDAGVIPTGHGLQVFGGQGTTEAAGYLKSIGLFSTRLSDAALQEFCVPRRTEAPLPMDMRNVIVARTGEKVIQRNRASMENAPR